MPKSSTDSTKAAPQPSNTNANSNSSTATVPNFSNDSKDTKSSKKVNTFKTVIFSPMN